MTWTHLGHIDPPPVGEGERSLVFYLGPNHYPAGLYLPEGYDIEWRPGDNLEWKVLRARDSVSGQILTLWAVRTDELSEGERVKILDP
jgi:hypothetical protein